MVWIFFAPKVKNRTSEHRFPTLEKGTPKCKSIVSFFDFTLEWAVSVLEMGHFCFGNAPFLSSEWAISILDIIDHPKPRELAFLYRLVFGPIWLCLASASASASSAFVFKVSKKWFKDPMVLTPHVRSAYIKVVKDRFALQAKERTSVWNRENGAVLVAGSQKSVIRFRV